MAELQAEIVTSQRQSLACAKRMYSLHCAREDLAGLSMAKLRGREGARMRKVYADETARVGVSWDRRAYDPNAYDSSDPINQALTSANSALYGIAHAVIAGLGFVPALGVVHNGTDHAFVYDIADLYKAEIAIPAAFDAVASGEMKPGVAVRRLVRDAVVDKRLMPKMVNDLKYVMDVTEDPRIQMRNFFSGASSK